ncbi:MAG: restriction endonuclease subunit S [Oscillospiraceae bacterium]|nr:restriction endonuclease subunit S [Oscillospiraceae bacterium]
MTKLDRLIADLCPNGVEFVKLGKIAVRTKGTPITAAQMKTLDKPNAPVKIFAGGKTVAYFDYADLPEKDVKTFPSVIVKSRGVIEFEYYDKPFSHKNEMWSYHSERENVDIKYLYYFLKTQENKLREKATSMGAFPQIAIPDTEQLQIPLPPLPVQQEIVRILDIFTELTAELTAELSARRVQYSYYRDDLLNLGQNVERVNLGDIATIRTGLNPRQFFKLNTGSDAPNYYVTIREIHNNRVVFSEKTDRINDEALRLCNNRAKLEVGDVLFSGTATIGETAVITETPTNWSIKEGVYVLKLFGERLLPRFLMYTFTTSKMKDLYKRKAEGGTVKSIPMKEMLKIQIPLPSLTEQERIVGILDRFDKLTTDIAEGLPAEITARKKQYEYYRDRLLSFEGVK